ncbi:MAG TPA: stage III sporulation protein AC [Firmicutes bacterium]|uniref:Stage III sporulation protein AC n=1 Tax=Capillibacterium thermochitinicola TaxID=2699427 RepID=A0A8J6I1D7_9FIRM|nr:stage III sporulation protein AC [Capillibacterium thermochitinicola]MBA2132909.1 stage III sporulation protein AC [Capillibacterium thermochitinicola]HHW11782.1 stage III sporulation protein AC [Bacillota bacterium]
MIPEVDLIFKIAGVGIIILLLNILFKQAGKDEYAYILTLVGVVLVFIVAIQMVQRFFQEVRMVFGF